MDPTSTEGQLGLITAYAANYGNKAYSRCFYLRSRRAQYPEDRLTYVRIEAHKMPKLRLRRRLLRDGGQVHKFWKNESLLDDVIVNIGQKGDSG